MKITRAYCEELETTVNIYEARRYFQKHKPSEKLHFLCSDNTCRRVRRPKVTGVNYDKLATRTHQFVKPHFRKNQEHLSKCEWVVGLPALTQQNSSPVVEDHNEPPQPAHSADRQSTPKLSDVVDIFVPGSGLRSFQCGRASGKEDDNRTGGLPTPFEFALPKKHSKLNPNRSGLLEEVVSSYCFLGEDERTWKTLQIGTSSPPRTYQKTFRLIENYRAGEDCSKCIYFGKVWGRKVGNDFLLIFRERTKNERTPHGFRLVTRTPLIGTLLREDLEDLVRSAKLRACYFYGDIRPALKDLEFFEITADFDDLVLRLK